MKTKILTVIYLLLVYSYIKAESITGNVFYKENNISTPLIGANVFWLNTTIATSTDTNGYFTIDKKENNTLLIVSYIGFNNDTILVKESTKLSIELKAIKSLKEVIINSQQQSSIQSTTKTINQVTLTEKELKKAACCNLSESFETEGSVDVMYSDAITGAKEIQILGLSGTYTQLMRENIPTLRGLATTFGLGYVPGTFMQSIQISKGAGSVVNGYESMTGQINLEYRKPLCDEPKIFLNLYANHLGRAEANLHLSKRFNEKVGGLLMVHGDNVSTKIDLNNDGFLDIPRSTQFNIYNRWETVFSEKVEMQSGVNVLYEDRIGGQTNFNHKKTVLEQNAYGVDIHTRRIDGFNKLGYLYHDKHSIGFIMNGVYHQQNAFYGKRKYDGKQTTGYLNIISQNEIANKAHTLKSGFSFLYDNYNEQFDSIILKRTELVPGVFSEYHYDNNRLSLLLGGRLDYHNLFGLQATPRIHFKYSLTENNIFRISGGRGFRVPNVFAENTNILVSSRNINILEKLRPEVSWNIGASFLKKFLIKEQEASFSVEYYRTQFTNQLITDLDQSTTEAYFYNLKGKSYGNNIQADFFVEIIEALTLRINYKFNDVKTTYNGVLLNKLMTAKHSGLLNIAYTTVNEKWVFDFTTQLNGKARLAHNAFTNESEILNRFSPVFVTLNAQITKKWKKIDWYIGGENLTNFKQGNPIVSAQNPFSPSFDASMVWGPIVGVVVYTGIRLTIQ